MNGEAATALPLAGTTILLLGAAPGYCGRLLAGLGATAILVEPPSGCLERREPPFAPGALGARSSLSFAFWLAGVRSVALDPTTQDGADVLRQAVGAAHCCVDALSWEQRSPWVEASATLLHEAGHAGPVVTLGPSGALSGIGVDDLVLQAASGLLYISGFAQDEPTPAPLALARMQSGLFGATAVLAAMLGGTDGAAGPSVQVGAQAALALTTLQSANPGFLTWQHVVPERRGLQGASGAPLRCRDGWVTFTAPPERWPALRNWLQDEGLLVDDLPNALEVAGGSLRAAMLAALPLVAQLAGRHEKRNFYHAAQRRGLICMPVNELSDVLADEHLRARNFFQWDEGGRLTLSAPFRSSPALWRTPGAAPRLGEFTEEFLTGVLGYARDDVEALLAMGAIACGL